MIIQKTEPSPTVLINPVEYFMAFAKKHDQDRADRMAKEGFTLSKKFHRTAIPRDIVKEIETD